MKACTHEFRSLKRLGYEKCAPCGTYRSLTAPPPEALYGADYWTHERQHSTLQEQVHNVDVHRENGLTKNEFVLRSIDTALDRSAALEIGCAPGRLLLQLRGMAGFHRVVGNEAHKAFEKDIREIGCHGGPLLWGFFPWATYCLQDASFSLIVALDVFEHSHVPEAFLAECARLLKRNGQVLLMGPFLEDHVKMPSRYFHAEEHVFMHSRPNLQAMIEDAGLCVDGFARWTAGHELISGRKP